MLVIQMGLMFDSFFARRVCSGRSYYDYYKVYFSTNEKLDLLLDSIDFKDKEVLSVLASTDQYLKIKKLGAKKVETFDINILTYYYCFIRLWSIKYFGMLYPVFIVENDYDKFNDLLSKVDASSDDEKKALCFWKKLLNNKVDFSKMFHFYKKNLLSDDAESFMEIAKEKVDFSKFDLTKKQKFNKKYDIVFISNILEWTNGDCVSTSKIENNLLSLLRDNGVVLCSKLNYVFEYNDLHEQSVFMDNFEYCDLGENVGYSFVKK